MGLSVAAGSFAMRFSSLGLPPRLPFLTSASSLLCGLTEDNISSHYWNECFPLLVSSKSLLFSLQCVSRAQRSSLDLYRSQPKLDAYGKREPAELPKSGKCRQINLQLGDARLQSHSSRKRFRVPRALAIKFRPEPVAGRLAFSRATPWPTALREARRNISPETEIDRIHK